MALPRMTGFGARPRVELVDGSGRVTPHPTPVIPGRHDSDDRAALGLIELARRRAMLASMKPETPSPPPPREPRPWWK